MFGIGGGELLFIIFIALMLFGSDKIPEIARTLGKVMAQLKNATNEIKSEIQKGADANGIDTSLKDFASFDSAEVRVVDSTDFLKFSARFASASTLNSASNFGNICRAVICRDLVISFPSRVCNVGSFAIT
jgi:sec-independent protein translocase protein TatA